MTLTITMPLPTRVLSPNGRSHWSVKAKAVKTARNTAHMLARQQLGGIHPKHKCATTQIEWHSKTKMHPDPDGALSSCKSAIDGIADAGFIANDRDLTHQPVKFFVDKKNPRLVIHVTPLP